MLDTNSLNSKIPDKKNSHVSRKIIIISVVCVVGGILLIGLVLVIFKRQILIWFSVRKDVSQRDDIEL